MAKSVKKEEKAMVIVEVKFYETNSARKKNNPLGVFTIPVEPVEIAPINEELEGEELEKDRERFLQESDAEDLRIREVALEKVHEYTNWKGVLVASVVEEV